jgi:DNA anti-recombination protein RmuC
MFPMYLTKLMVRASGRRSARTSNQRVEYAIKLPGGDQGEAPLWLPIDAKFPHEDYEKLVDASERGDVEAAEAASSGGDACSFVG